MPGVAKRVLAWASILAAVSVAAAVPAACSGGDGGDRANGTTTDGSAGELRAGTARGGERSAAGTGEEGAERAWERAPVLPGLDAAAVVRLRREVARSRRAGMRGGVFAKVGDSNSDYPGQLYGLGCRPVRLGPRDHLAPPLRRYRSVRLTGLDTYPGCRPPNSFSRDSAAAVSNATSEWAVTPSGEASGPAFIVPSGDCPDGLSPVRCEIGLTRPRYVMTMIGSGDAVFGYPLGKTLEENLRQLVGAVRAAGPVPVLATVPPVATGYGRESERIAETNRVIWAVARRLRVPLINVWRAMTGPRVINRGLAPDGLHLGVAGGDGSPRILRNAANLTPPALRYGANRRNLIWLMALHRLDRAAAGAGGSRG